MHDDGAAGDTAVCRSPGSVGLRLQHRHPRLHHEKFNAADQYCRRTSPPDEGRGCFLCPGSRTLRGSLTTGPDGKARAPDGAKGRPAVDGHARTSLAWPHSTARDYARFLEAMRLGGTIDNVRLLSTRSVKLMSTNQVGTLHSTTGLGWGLGFETTDRYGASGMQSEGSFGWAGAYGSTYRVDPEARPTMIRMIQQIPNGTAIQAWHNLITRRCNNVCRRLAVAATTIAARQAKPAYAGTLDDHPAIQYASTAPNDPVQRLADDLASGKRTLARQEPTGYLQSVLAALNVPIESQVRVLSKTGIQKDFTSPANPRQFFFNESTYVGYIPGAPLLELASHDPQQGVQFYFIKQGAETATISRAQVCISCHLAAATLDVPGIIDRSNHIDGSGVPSRSSGSRSSITPRLTASAGADGRQRGRDRHPDAVQSPVARDQPADRLNWEWRVAARQRHVARWRSANAGQRARGLLPSPAKLRCLSVTPRKGFAEHLVGRFPRDSKGDRWQSWT